MKLIKVQLHSLNIFLINVFLVINMRDQFCIINQMNYESFLFRFVSCALTCHNRHPEIYCDADSGYDKLILVTIQVSTFTIETKCYGGNWNIRVWIIYLKCMPWNTLKRPPFLGSFPLYRKRKVKHGITPTAFSHFCLFGFKRNW